MLYARHEENDDSSALLTSYLGTYHMVGGKHMLGLLCILHHNVSAVESRARAFTMIVGSTCFPYHKIKKRLLYRDQSLRVLLS